MEWCTESEALQDQYDGEAMAADDEREWREEKYENKISAMRDRYRDNARSAVGTTIRCACCGRRILKKNYQTQFCSNKGRGNCKDTYWNNTNDKRRARAQTAAKLKR